MIVEPTFEPIGDKLIMYHLFDRPLDYPDRVIVVRHLIHRGWTERIPAVWAFASVDEARELLAGRELVPIPRDDSDVASLVETWF